MDILVAVISKFLVFFMLLTALNLLVGKLNLWAFGYIGFFGLGSFLSVYLHRYWGIDAWTSLFIALFGGLLIALAFGRISIKLGEKPFLVLNLFWTQAVYSLIVFYGGPRGIFGFKRPDGFMGILQSPAGFLMAILLPAVLVLSLSVYLYARAPLHRWAYFVRSFPREAEIYGYKVDSLRTALFVVGAFWSILSGILYAWFIGGTDPSVATPYWGLLIFALVLVGGVDSLSGSVVAAVLLTVLPMVIAKLFAFSPKASFYGAHISQILFGILVIAMVRFFPQGIAGRRVTWSKEGY